MARWILWAAVSSLPQAKKISLDDQISLGAEHAAMFQGEVVDKLIVPGQSRSIILFETARQKIEAYDQLAKHIESRDFDVLCFLDRSRLGRKASLSMTIVALCEEAGIICYEVENPPSSLEISKSHDDQLIGAIKSVGAEREIKKMVARRAMGMKERVKRGEHAGRLPYGYVVDPNSREKKVIVNESQAAIIRGIINDYMMGRGCTGISNALNEKLIPSPDNGKWVATTVYRLLSNVMRYAGFVFFTDNKTGEITKGSAQYEPIIDKNIADRVLKEIANRHNHRKLSSDHQNSLYSGIFYCGCGRRMRRHNPAGRVEYIRCVAEHEGRHSITLKKALAQFHEAISSAKLEDFYTQKEPQKAMYEAQIENIDKSIANLEKSRQRASDAFTDGIMEIHDYARQTQRIKAQLDQYEAEKQRLRSAIEQEDSDSTKIYRAKEFIEQVDSWLNHPDIREANQWLREHVRLTVTDGELSSIDIL